MSTAEPTPNLPLLRKVWEWIQVEAQKPEAKREWYQGSWRFPARARNVRYQRTDCGTAFCVAGYACHVSGLDWLDPNDYGLDEFLADGGRVEDRAEELLGLTYDEAEHLFFAGNTVGDIREQVRAIAARGGEDWS